MSAREERLARLLAEEAGYAWLHPGLEGVSMRREWSLIARIMLDDLCDAERRALARLREEEGR